MNAPRLIEPGIKNYIYNALQASHGTKQRIFTIILNLSVFIGFLAVFGTVLYFCYKRKPSDYEAHQKVMKDQQYILSKIRLYQGEQRNISSSNITQLPIK